MKTIYGMVLSTFILVFLVSVLFFVLVVQLLDLFSNLWRYLAHETSLQEILTIAYYYLPKCLSYAASAWFGWSCPSCSWAWA
jgi:lipopolysaccharide export system permease protein